MSSTGDRLSGLGKGLKKNLDKVLIAAMAGTLLLNLLFWFSESQTFPYDPPPPERTEPKVSISRDKPEYRAVMSLSERLPDFEASEYKILVDLNMFDPKSQKDTAQLQQIADELVTQARKALEAGNLDEAEELAKQALGKLPTHKPGKDISDEIDAKRAEKAKEEGKKPGSGAPGPAAAPKAPPPAAPR